ncbi:hypothetical protein CEQ90_04225 [Lewinellaceae bacterium SD302]|nr:hypothetical protein CEQ90_04225 [Lewinellaceae bacterium SD302]
MSLRTWLIKLLGGEPQLSTSNKSTASDRRSGDRVITTTTTISQSADEAVKEEEIIGSLSLSTEMDELLYLTANSVSHFDLSGKGVSIVFTAGELRVTDTLSSTIFIGGSSSGQQLLELPITSEVTYDVFFNQASATLIIAGQSATERDDDCKLYLFPIDDRRISIMRGKRSLVVRES